MANERLPNDVGKVWQNQPTEGAKMSLNQIRKRAECFQKGLRRQNLLAYMVLGFLVAAFGWIALVSPNLVARTGAALFVAGCLFTAHQVYRRGGRRQFPGDGAFADCLSFHRSELRLLRDFHNSVGLRLLALTPGYLIFLAGIAKADPARWRYLGAVAVAFLAFGLFGLWLQLWLGRRVRREIEALDAVETQR